MKRLNSKIRRIGRQKIGRGQNRIQGRGDKTGRKQAIGQPSQESLRGAKGAKREVERPAWKPGPNHPWKRMVISTKKYHGNK